MAKRDVYDPEQFWYRVQFAASYIARGVPDNSRHFDTCFEMCDGNAVCAALVRRALRRPDSRFAANLFRVLDSPRVMQHYEATKHLTRKQLAEEARRQRDSFARVAVQS